MAQAVPEELEDIISTLPKEIRTKIIDLLPIEDALRTCILSKIWRDVFSSLSNLIFTEADIPNADNRHQCFATLINWTLANHDDSDICTFVIISNRPENSWVPIDNAWITCAVQHNVQTLNVTGKIDESEGLPSCLFTCRSLVFFQLITQDQILKLPPVTYLPNLKKLSFFGVIFPEDDTLTEKLFSGCPQLEYLFMRECEVFLLKKLRISSPKLIRLDIYHCIGLEKCDIYLQTPSLEGLYYDGHLAKKFIFEKMELISEVFFNLERFPEDRRTDSSLAPVAMSFLRAVSHARWLTINLFFHEVVNEDYFDFNGVAGFNGTYLCLCLSHTELNKEIVLSMLSKFKCVQELHLVICQQRDARCSDYLQQLPYKVSVDTILNNLQQLKIDNFEGRTSEMQLLKFFLRFKKSLSEILIKMPKKLSENDTDRQWARGRKRYAKEAILGEVQVLKNCFPTVPIVLQ